MEQCLNCFLKTFTFFPITCRNINLFYVQSIANWMKRRAARLFVLPSYQSLTFRLSAILLHVVNGEDRIRRRWYTRRELYLIHIILLFPFYFQKFISSIVPNLGTTKDKNISQKIILRSNTSTRDFSILLHFDLSGFLFRNLIFDVSIHHSYVSLEWSLFFFFLLRIKNQWKAKPNLTVTWRIKIRGNFPTDLEISKI